MQNTVSPFPTPFRQTASRKQASDIYAFGIVMYEILFRALPFPEGTELAGEFSGRLATGKDGEGEGSARNKKRRGEPAAVEEGVAEG